MSRWKNCPIQSWSDVGSTLFQTLATEVDLTRSLLRKTITIAFESLRQAVSSTVAGK